MQRKIFLAVTPGDPAGIGPEIVWKTAQEDHFPKSVTPICIGARAPFEKLNARVVEVNPTQITQIRTTPSQPTIFLIPAPRSAPKGRLLGGFQSGWSIEMAAHLVQEKKLDALVTGPIHKNRLQKGGYRFPGHTEFLAHLCKRKSVTMMLANNQLRVTLVTTHIALNRVSRSLTPAKIRETVLHTVESLNQWWGISRPNIAIAALNPHAGEGGLFGQEEMRVISPTIRSLQKHLKTRANLTGPLPADTLFAKHIMAKPNERFDAVVCMYHDQALIPVKLLDFPRTVNITLGLPIIRTSVDHGVGFDIVGTGTADPSSFQSAVGMAAQLVENVRK